MGVNVRLFRIRSCTMSLMILISLVLLTESTETSTGLIGGPCNPLPAVAPCNIINSICVNNMCICAPTYQLIQSSCQRLDGETTVSKPCMSSFDCHGDGEFCGYGYCRCLSSHVEIDRKCLPVVYPGQLGCEDNRQCAAAFPGSMCRGRFCECPGGLLALGQTCTTNNSSLPLPNDNYRERNRYVGRQAPPPINPPQPSTFGTISPGGVCSQEQDCSGYPYAYCLGTCMCRDGAINAGSTCLEPGSSSRGNCGANQVYVSEAGACMNSAKPGAPCQYSQQCSGMEVGAFCVNLRCRCVYGMIVTGDGKCTFINSNCTTRGTVWISELGECKPVIGPGARTCSHKQQCVASYPDSMCFLTQCTCPPEKPVAVDGTCGTSCTAGQTFSGVLGKCVPTVQPGDRCQYSSQCHAIYPGMICDRGTCRCPNSQMWTGSSCSSICPTGYMQHPDSGLCRPACRSNQIEHEGDCLDVCSPGETCRINSQCQGGSTCVNLVCTCPLGTQNLHGTCTKAQSPPGGSCANGELCSGNSFCENDLCVCRRGMVVSNQRCITPPTVPPRSPCGPTVICGGNSICLGGICTCPHGQVAQSGQCQIPSSIPPGYPCTESELCSGGAYCKNGVCTCPTGTLNSNGQCQVPLQVPPGSACRPGLEICTGLSYCVSGLCTCPSGMVSQGAVCGPPPVVFPGSACDNSEKCTGGSVCTNGICACPSGANIVGQQCQQPISVPPNAACTWGDKCAGGSTCQLGICRCPVGQVPVHDLCQSSTAFHSIPCLSSAQCPNSFACLNGICQCPPYQSLTNGICSAKARFDVAPNSLCHARVRCGGGSSCIKGLCKCPSEHVIRSGRCVFVEVVPPGSSCANGERCGGGSLCVDRICVCPRDKIVLRELCVNAPTVGPMSSCANGETCSGGSYCQNGLCNCPPDSVVKDALCVRQRDVPPGGPCPTENEVCTGGSNCYYTVCTCPTGQIIRNNMCTAGSLVPYTFLCRENGECVGGAFCDSGVCVCPNSTLLVDGICQSPVTLPPSNPMGFVGKSFNRSTPLESCANGEICTGGSYCHNRICICPPGSIPNEFECEPSPAVPPGSLCTAGESCSGGAVCIRGTCVCPPSYIAANGMCQPSSSNSVPPMSSCASGERCDGGSRCISGTCLCAADQVVINQQCQTPPVVRRRRVIALAEFTPQPGQPCAPGQMCGGGSVCLSNVCQCPTGTALENNICISRQVGPGFSCANGEKCCGGSRCSNGVCTCPMGTIQVDADCVNSNTRYVTPGQQCDTSTVCSGGSFCQNNICLCPAGQIIQNQQCISSGIYVLPGQSCMDPTSVCTARSQCVAGVCVCPSGEILQNNQCMQNTGIGIGVFPGQPCSPPQACYGGSTCINGYCTCPPNNIVQNNECRFVQTTGVLPGLICDTITVCLGGSSCVNGICACSSGYVVQNGNCLFQQNTVTPGSPCLTGTTVCSGGAVCQFGWCTCTTGKVIFNDQCVPYAGMILPGGLCTTPGTICSGGAMCQNGRCVCLQNYVIRFDVCVLPDGVTSPKSQVFPGADCYNGNSSCSGGSLCVNNKCVCPAGLLAKQGQCTKSPMTVNPGTVCDSSCPWCQITCTGGSSCINGACLCPFGYTVQNDQCVSMGGIGTAYPGSVCFVDTLCGGGSLCQNGVCLCPQGQTVGPSGKCKIATSKIAEPGAICISTQTVCTGGSICQHSYCLCPEGTLNQGGLCLPLRTIGKKKLSPGSPCNENVTCSDTGVSCSNLCSGGSQCVSGFCLCPSKQQNIIDGECQDNFPEETLPIGSPCTNESKCDGGSLCQNGICMCPSGEVVLDGKCATEFNIGGSGNLLPGSPCNETSQCAGGAQCRERLCMCLPGTVIQNGVCVSTVGGLPPGAPCSFDSIQCSGGSSCVNGVCTCPDNQMSHQDRCLPNFKTVPPGTPCAKNIVCGGSSNCVNGVCACSPAEVIQNGRCVAPHTSVPPGSWCGGDVVCNGGSECYNDVCQCPFGQIIANLQCASAPLVPPGSSCSNGEICGGGSICTQGRCLCPSGTTNIGQLCQNDPQPPPPRLLSERAVRCPLPENPSSCVLPNCFCSKSGKTIPGGLSAGQTPQMVILTFDDPVNVRTIDIFKSVFDGRYKNKNNCPIKGTFFLSHEWNHYDDSQWLYWQGHEIGVNSITHETISNEPVTRWYSEMDGMRKLLSNLGRVNERDIGGIRAPQLGVGGNNQFEMMRRYNFQYDNSMSANPGKEGDPFWPQTLDYKISWKCEIPPCPDLPFAGTWAVPINQFYSHYLAEIQQHQRGAMVRSVMTAAESSDDVYNILMENFQRAYNTNRAPYVLTLNADFLLILPNNGSVTALERFLRDILTKDNVWIVTLQQALAWIQRPTPADQLLNFPAWQCTSALKAEAEPCRTPKRCTYETERSDGERWFETCSTCPDSYPWLDNDIGRRNLH